MRVNVYSEELTELCEVVTTTSQNGEAFTGLRVWLDCPPGLKAHNTPADNDTPAVTFWFSGYRGLFEFIEKVKRARLEYVRANSLTEAGSFFSESDAEAMTTISFDRLRELENCEKIVRNMSAAMEAMRGRGH